MDHLSQANTGRREIGVVGDCIHENIALLPRHLAIVFWPSGLWTVFVDPLSTLASERKQPCPDDDGVRWLDVAGELARDSNQLSDDGQLAMECSRAADSI